MVNNKRPLNSKLKNAVLRVPICSVTLREKAIDVLQKISARIPREVLYLFGAFVSLFPSAYFEFFVYSVYSVGTFFSAPDILEPVGRAAKSTFQETAFFPDKFGGDMFGVGVMGDTSFVRTARAFDFIYPGGNG